MLIKWKSYRSNLFGFIAAQTTCFEFKQLSTSLLTLVNTTQAACTYQWKFFLELCHKITPKVYNLRNFCELAHCAFGFNHFLWPWQARLYAPLFRPDLSVNLAIAKANAQVDNRSPAQSGVSTLRRWLSLSMNFVAKIRACNYSGYPGRGTPKEKKRRIICINFSVAQWELARWVILTLKFVKDFYGHMYV